MRSKYKAGGRIHNDDTNASPNPVSPQTIGIPMRELLNGEQTSRENKKQMTDEAMMNIICDNLAGATTRAALEGGDAQGRVLLDLPYQGSRAMLKIKNRWVTSRYADELYKARRPGPMREYCKQKYD